MKKEIWVDLSSGDWNNKKSILTTALENGITTIILDPKEIVKARKIGQMKIGVYYTNNDEEINNVKPDFVIVSRNQDYTSSLQLVKQFEIEHNEDVEEIQRLKDNFEYFIIKAKDWKIIPLENLIADFQKSQSKLIPEVTSIEEAKVFLETLEKGTDGVLLKNPTAKKVREISKIMKQLNQGKIELVPAKITKIKSLGSGDRVCVDTCSMLKIGEGMLVGSQSDGMFLVHSESLESEYVASRPFRVNAGPVHSYVSIPENKTKYLSELKAGDEVLIVDAKGATRSAIVGRVKIEVRPLMLIEAEVNKKIYKIILQNAETIRLVDSSGNPVSITQLSEGDEVLIHVTGAGRHFGTKIEESIVER
ncbi:MAG: 3-dehydroquinate synthase II [Candidatus Odinarchaeia archaeon]